MTVLAPNSRKEGMGCIFPSPMLEITKAAQQKMFNYTGKNLVVKSMLFVAYQLHVCRDYLRKWPT